MANSNQKIEILAKLQMELEQEEENLAKLHVVFDRVMLEILGTAARLGSLQSQIRSLGPVEVKGSVN